MHIRKDSDFTPKGGSWPELCLVRFGDQQWYRCKYVDGFLVKDVLLEPVDKYDPVVRGHVHEHMESEGKNL